VRTTQSAVVGTPPATRSSDASVPAAVTEAVASPRHTRRRPDVTLSYVDGFDGLRGGALILMLLGHHGWDAIPGALFTVSMFFTLSGYLIATLMLAEWGRSGRVSLARFWERRARRLLPAAFATVLFVVALHAWFGVGSGPRFRGDLLSALGYVANWRMYASGTDYAATFSMESPVQHFWSLAIEEQFYLVFPLAFLALMALARRRWGVVGVVFGAGALLSYALAWVSSARYGNVGITYYGTFTRVSEILAGVALAFLLATSPMKRFLASPRGAVVARVLGLVGLVVFVVLICTIGLEHPFAFRGGTVLNGLCIWFIIIACVSPAPGLLVRGLSVAPLRGLGKVTYTVYLVHLPIYLVLDAERTGLDFWPLFAVRVLATLPVVLISYHLIESPFRFRMRMPRRQLIGVLAVPAIAVAALVLIVPVREPETVDLVAATEMESPLVADAVTPGDGVEPAARILLVGDSVTWSMLPGFEAWNQEHGEQVHVDAHFAVACTLGEPGPVRSLGRIEDPYQTCEHLRSDLPETLDRADYDAIIVTLGQKDLSDRRVEGAWRHLGDPVFDAWLRPQIDELADLVAAEGAPVLWSTASHVRIPRANDPTSDWRDYPDNDPARVDRLNELFAEEIAGRPGFALLPVGEWMQVLPGGEFDTAHRADGVHYTIAGSEAYASWVVPQILGQGCLPSLPCVHELPAPTSGRV
jgi:peptidoglycan/LPS O-acetylase OafA/YrhL